MKGPHTRQSLSPHGCLLLPTTDSGLPFLTPVRLKTTTTSFGSSVRIFFAFNLHSIVDSDDFLCDTWRISKFMKFRVIKIRNLYVKVEACCAGLSPEN